MLPDASVTYVPDRTQQEVDAMTVSSRMVLLSWIAWTLLLAARSWWEWRRAFAPGTIGVVAERPTPLAVLARLAVFYAPVAVLTGVWWFTQRQSH